MTKTIRVLFLAAEAEPFIKVGGLADVAGSLPLALRGLAGSGRTDFKLDLRLVLPQHRALPERVGDAASGGGIPRLPEGEKPACPGVQVRL